MTGRTERTTRVPDEVAEAARGARRVVVLGGAGMSAESGVPTFRDAHSGLWERHDPESLVSVAGWAEDPALVWAFHWGLGRLVKRCAPNPGHRALAELAHVTEVAIVTQNIDDLHERAGSDVLAHLHGDLFSFSCSVCGHPLALDVPPLGDGERVPERIGPPSCPVCGEDVRPDVVWFGEMLPQGAFDRAVDAILAADLCLVVGTSGVVQPAASLPDLARGHGVPTVEINPQPTEISRGMSVCWRETAGRALPALVAALRD